jgi:hypothetical protein
VTRQPKLHEHYNARLIPPMENKRSTRFEIEKWFWAFHVIPAVWLYTFDRGLFDAVGVLYLVLLSIWTQVRNLDGAADSARANESADADDEHENENHSQHEES